MWILLCLAACFREKYLGKTTVCIIICIYYYLKVSFVNSAGRDDETVSAVSAVITSPRSAQLTTTLLEDS